jgi:archaeal chaperonin
VNYVTEQQVPIVLLKEGSTEVKGKDAQKNNIIAAKVIADVVKSSLGPRGMDKMLVDSLGDVTITNDGATILKDIDVEHPAAKMMVEISKSIDNEVGDGTTSSVVIAGALLEKAEELINKKIHATIVVDGYKKCSTKANEILKNIATPVAPDNRIVLKNIAKTSMASKMISVDSERLSEIAIDAVLTVADRSQEQSKVDIDYIKVEKKPGGSVDDTSLIRGLVMDKEIVHAGMPRKIENAKIAIVSSPLEIEKTEFDAKINIDSPDQMNSFLEQENKLLKAMVDKVVSAGANVLVCQKGIDDMAQYYLAKAGILAIRRANEKDMSKIAKATGGRIIGNIDEFSLEDLGYADLVEERKVESDKWVFVEGCKNPKSVTILVRGGSQRVVDEAERSLHDAIMCVKDVIEYPYIVAGGGAAEAMVSKQIREWSNTLPGREQLAGQIYAEALESIPLTLAQNAGMDVIDTQVQLRAKIAQSEKPRFGIDVVNGKVADMGSKNIYEPLLVKENIIKSATEAASMILRIDDVIAASKTKSASKHGAGPNEGMPDRMGDY